MIFCLRLEVFYLIINNNIYINIIDLINII